VWNFQVGPGQSKCQAYTNVGAIWAAYKSDHGYVCVYLLFLVVVFSWRKVCGE
jgi:hypothetical protein